MVKVRLKRVKHGPYFNAHQMDEHFVNVSVPKMPKKGKPVIFYFDNPYEDLWMTTTVVSIIRRKRLTIFNTINSRYHIKKV